MERTYATLRRAIFPFQFVLVVFAEATSIETLVSQVQISSQAVASLQCLYDMRQQQISCCLCELLSELSLIQFLPLVYQQRSKIHQQQ
jgi:hypothetical protein